MVIFSSLIDQTLNPDFYFSRAMQVKHSVSLKQDPERMKEISMQSKKTKVIQMYKNGVFPSKIAAALSLPFYFVGRVLSESEPISKEKAREMIRQAQSKKAIYHRKKGLSLSQIAEEIGCSKSHVYKLLKEKGVS